MMEEPEEGPESCTLSYGKEEYRRGLLNRHDHLYILMDRGSLYHKVNPTVHQIPFKPW